MGRTEKPNVTMNSTNFLKLGVALSLGLLLSISPFRTEAMPEGGYDISLLAAIEPSETLILPLPNPPIRPIRTFARLPLSFERNEGQADPAKKFQARGRGYLLSLEQTEAVMVLAGRAPEGAKRPGMRCRSDTGDTAFALNGGTGMASQDCCPQPAPLGHLLRMKLVGASVGALVTGEDELPGKHNYFIGNDPSLWRKNIPTFAKVHYHEVYPGIDLVYYGNEGRLEYDFIVGPGADPNRIAFSIEGADRIELDERGDLRLRVADQELCWHKPKIYQQIDTVRVEVHGEYVLRSPSTDSGSAETHRLAFQLADYDRSRALVIDPILSYSTFLGGGIGDQAYGVAVDSAGCAYVTGVTYSRVSYNGTPSPGNPFPTTTNAIKRTFSLLGAAFVTKFNPAGDQMLYSTVLCGTTPTSQSSGGSGIVVDATGRAVITGETDATDFPRKNALQPTYGGGFSEAFVAKLNPDGSALVFSTFLGGSGYEYSSRIALDQDSSVYVAGRTSSPNFPTANAVQQVYGGNYDLYVAKMDADGTKRFYSTFLGGTNNEWSPALAVDPAGHAYVAGYREGADGPIGVVAKLSLSGSALEYSKTNLAGMSVGGIAVDSAGAVYLTGGTSSDTLATTPNAFQRLLAGESDVFVAKLNSAGSVFEYLTYVGGTARDGGSSITVDRNGNAFVAGSTTSADFPTLDPLQAQNNSPDPDGGDAFVLKLNADGGDLLWSTYLGGSTPYWNYNGLDAANALTLDSTGALYVAGKTTTSDFPVRNAFQSELDTSHGAQDALQDAFIAKIVEPSPPVLLISRLGSSVSISWPVSADGFNLESSTSLGAAANWIAESSPPSVAGDQNVVTIEIGETSKFFRLRK